MAQADDPDIGFDDDDAFGGGMEESPLTLQEEMELERAFEDTDSFLTGFRSALDNAGAAAVAAATTDTLLFQTPFKSEAGQAIQAAGVLVDDLEGTAQALVLNEIGDAILASGMGDFFEPVSARDSSFCDVVDQKIRENQAFFDGIRPGQVFVHSTVANEWVIDNGTRSVVWIWKVNDQFWSEHIWYGFTPAQVRSGAVFLNMSTASGAEVKDDTKRWIKILGEAKVRQGCFTTTGPVQPSPTTTPQPQPPPAAPGVPAPFPPGVAAIWCGVEYTAKDIEAEYGPGWQWYPPQPSFGNPRLPTISATFNPEDPGPQTDAEWQAQWIEELATWGPGELDPYYADNYLTFFRLPWGIPPGWEAIDDYKGPLKANEAWVIDYFQTGVGDTTGLPFFNNHIRPHIPGGERTRIACIPGSEEKPPQPPGEGKQPVVAPSQPAPKEAEPAAECGQQIEICNWGDLAKILGGGETGLAGTCQLWEDCDSGIIYATTKGQEPRNDSDKPLDAAEIGIADLERFIASCTEDAADKPGENGVVNGGNGLGGILDSTGCAVLPKAASWLDDSLVNPLIDLFLSAMPLPTDVPTSLAQLITMVADYALNEEESAVTKWFGRLDKLFTSIIRNSECQSPEFLKYKSAEILVGFLNSWLGGGFSDALTAISQQARYLCPISVPSAQDATTAYLADAINKDTLDCWSRANGMMTEGWDRVVEANRSKLGVNELVQLLRRNEIGSVEFQKRVRQLGFLHQTEAAEFATLGQVIPPVSDLVRFMVRDTADEKVYKPFKMDEGFTDKFKDQVESWANDQGVDKEYMRHVWRAHWSIPSPSQLFSMLHRNSRLDPTDKAYVDLKTVKAALKQQDIMPFWIDPLLNISYRPLNRVDTRRAFDTGVLTKAEVKEAYLNQGYDDANSTVLANFAERVRSMRFLRHASIRKYATGALNGKGLEKWAIADGAIPADIPVMIDRATDVMVGDARLECVKSYERRFQHGEFSSAVLTEKLGGEQLDAAQVEQLVKAAECKRAASGKQASISQLCKWYTEGIMQEYEFYDRLLELNWDEDDANRLIRDCQIKQEIVLSKEAAKRLREAMKRTKANQARLNKSAAERERARKRALTASNSAKSRRLRISRLMDKAAAVYAKKADIEPVDALAILTAITTRLKAATLFTFEEIGQALVFITKTSDTVDVEPLYLEVVATLNQAIIPEPVGN